MDATNGLAGNSPAGIHQVQLSPSDGDNNPFATTRPFKRKLENNLPADSNKKPGCAEPLSKSDYSLPTKGKNQEEIIINKISHVFSLEKPGYSKEIIQHLIPEIRKKLTLESKDSDIANLTMIYALSAPDSKHIPVLTKRIDELTENLVENKLFIRYDLLDLAPPIIAAGILTGLFTPDLTSAKLSDFIELFIEKTHISTDPLPTHIYNYYRYIGIVH